MMVSFVRPHVMREYSRLNLFDVTHMSNGIFAGLVGITSACDSVEPWAAFVIGLISGIFYIFGSWLLQKLKIDDPSDSLPSSFFCAIWGVLSAGIFEELDEINIESKYSNTNRGVYFSYQVLGIVCIMSWCGLISCIYF